MDRELEIKKDSLMQSLLDVERLPTSPEADLAIQESDKIPLSNLAALGIAFQPLVAAIQTVFTSDGGSGIYFVNTMGKQMHRFQDGSGFLGALQTASGGVGGGQARLIRLPCDPTMLFMAAALMNIEKKLDIIQKTQEEIFAFLEEKERAALQGNLNVLEEVMGNFKYNWNNEKYKSNKHILVQQIKKEAEASIVLYQNQIARKLKKRSPIHGDQEVRGALKKLHGQFQDYQLALYLYAYSAFLEVMLLGNFSEGYLNSVEQRISEYSFGYRSLYTQCYNLMEGYSKSSIQAGVLKGLAATSKLMGDTITKVPVISRSQLDENLIEAGSRLDRHGKRRTVTALAELAQVRMSVTTQFEENIRTINALYNKPTFYLFDGENVYVRQEEGI